MRRVLALGLALIVGVGCSSSSSDGAAGGGGPTGTGKTTTAVIGAKGGDLVHPEGATLSVPAGSLTADKTISITSTTEAPPPPLFASWSSPIFHVAPDDVTFSGPASMSIDFTGNPKSPTIFWSTDGATFIPMPSTVAGSKVTASIVSLGFGFVGPAFALPPGGDKCAPYVGDYAGILAFQWSAYDTPKECLALTPRSGTGTITVHFTTTCLGPTPTGQIVLNVTTVSTDNSYFQTPFPSPADPALSQMQMPPNPPTSGQGAISLGFKHGDIEMGPKVTVTTDARKISSDVGVTNGFILGTVPGDESDAPFWAAGMPKPIGAINCAKVDSRTFKVDKL